MTEIYCNACNRKTNHVEKRSYLTEEFVKEEEIGHNDNYYIYECAGCNSVSFVHVHYNSGDLMQLEDGNVGSRHYYTFYPEREEGIRNKQSWYEQFNKKFRWTENSNLITVYDKIYDGLLRECKISTMIFIRCTMEIAVNILIAGITPPISNPPTNMTGGGGKLERLLSNSIITQKIKDELEEVVYKACSATVHQAWTLQSDAHIARIIDILDSFLYHVFVKDEIEQKHQEQKDNIKIQIPPKI